VPTLVLEDGRALAESGAILWYLGEGTRFVPGDSYERAQVLQWMFYEQYELEPAIAVTRFWVAYSGRAEEFEPERPAKMKAGDRVLKTLDRHLEERDWMVGDAFTLADIALYAYTHVAEEGGFDLQRHASLRRWHERIASQPGHVPIDA
jgi:glutathione S-transferase